MSPFNYITITIMIIITKYAACRAEGYSGAEWLHQCRCEGRQKQEGLFIPPSCWIRLCALWRSLCQFKPTVIMIVIQEGTHFELNILRIVPYIAPAYTLLQTHIHTHTQVHTARGNLFLQCLLCDVVTLKLKRGVISTGPNFCVISEEED